MQAPELSLASFSPAYNLYAKLMQLKVQQSHKTYFPKY